LTRDVHASDLGRSPELNQQHRDMPTEKSAKQLKKAEKVRSVKTLVGGNILPTGLRK
jgi:hypothetical protein